MSPPSTQYGTWADRNTPPITLFEKRVPTGTPETLQKVTELFQAQGPFQSNIAHAQKNADSSATNMLKGGQYEPLKNSQISLDIYRDIKHRYNNIFAVCGSGLNQNNINILPPGSTPTPGMPSTAMTSLLEACKPVSSFIGTTLGTMPGVASSNAQPVGVNSNIGNLLERINPRIKHDIMAVGQAFKLDQLANLPSQLMGSVRNVASSINKFLSGPISMVKDLYQGAMGAFQKMQTLVGTMFNKLKGMANKAVGFALGAAQGLLGKVVGSLGSLTSGLTSKLGNLTSAFTGSSLLGNFQGSLLGKLSSGVLGGKLDLGGLVSGKLGALTGSLTGGLTGKLGGLADGLMGKLGGLAGGIGGKLGGLAGGLGDKLGGLAGGLSSKLGGLAGGLGGKLSNLGGIADKLTGKLSGLTDKLNIGDIAGKLKGLAGKLDLGNLTGKISGLAGGSEGITNAVKGVSGSVSGSLGGLASGLNNPNRAADAYRSTQTAFNKQGYAQGITGGGAMPDQLNAPGKWQERKDWAMGGGGSGSAAIDGIVNKVGDVVGGIAGKVGGIAGKVAGAANNVVSGVVGAANNVVSGVVGAANKVVGSIAGSITGGLNSAINAVKGGLSGITGMLKIGGNLDIGKLAGKLGGLGGFDIKNPLQMANAFSIPGLDKLKGFSFNNPMAMMSKLIPPNLAGGLGKVLGMASSFGMSGNAAFGLVDKLQSVKKGVLADVIKKFSGQAGILSHVFQGAPSTPQNHVTGYNNVSMSDGTKYAIDKSKNVQKTSPPAFINSLRT